MANDRLISSVLPHPPRLPVALVMVTVFISPLIVTAYTHWPAAMDVMLAVQRGTLGLVTQTLQLSLVVLAVVLAVMIGFGRLRLDHLGLRRCSVRPALVYTACVVVLINLLALLIAGFAADGPRWASAWMERPTEQIGRWLGQFFGNALLEEVLWRAFLIPQLALWLVVFGVRSERRRWMVATLAAAVLFALSHLPIDVAHELSPRQHFWMFWARFISALVFSVIWVRTGNLLIVVACHALLNEAAPAVEPVRPEVLAGAVVIGTLIWSLVRSKRCVFAQA